MTQRKKYPKRVYKEVLVTPKMAKQWLSDQTKKQRTKKLHMIIRFVRDILANRWMLNGHGIVLDWNGSLLDGQNRLESIVRADKPILTLVVYGIDPQAYKTIDSGMARTLRDILKAMGEVYYTDLASSINLYHQYTSGLFGYASHSLTFQEAVDLLKKHTKMKDSVAHAAKTKRLLSIGVGTFLHYIFAAKDKKKADMFFEKLSTGDCLGKESPIRTLRDQLLENKGRPSYHRYRRPFLINIVIKCWNDVRAGNNRRKSYTWRTTGDDSEPYCIAE